MKIKTKPPKGGQGITHIRKEKKKMKETIALNPVVRPKNGQQFMAKRLPYWKTPEYKKAMQERKEQ